MPASGLRLAEVCPQAAREFRANLTHPDKPVEQLTPASSDLCVWECEHHPVTWESTPRNRTQELRRGGSLYGCRECKREKIRDAARLRQTSDVLAVARPDVAALFVRNLTYPSRGPNEIRLGSDDKIIWRCPRCLNEEGPLSTWARCKREPHVTCRGCRTIGQSLIEQQVADLVAATLKTSVTTQHRIGKWSIDLWLPGMRVGVDIDPPGWHPESRTEVDTRKAHELTASGVHFYRLRQRTMSPTGPWDIWVDHSRMDPIEWARPLVEVLTRKGATKQTLSASSIQRVLRHAARTWRDRCQAPPTNSLAIRHPSLGEHFVANLDRPGMTPTWLATGSSDRCLWRCTSCKGRFERTVHAAATAKYGSMCRPCSNALPKESTRPPLGASLAETHAESARSFIENLTKPGRSPQWMTSRVDDRCLWLCECGGTFERPVSRMVESLGLCRPCARRVGARRAALTRGQSAAA